MIRVFLLFLILIVTEMPASAMVHIGESGCYEIQGKFLSIKSAVIQIEINSNTRSQQVVSITLTNLNRKKFLFPKKGYPVSILSLTQSRGDIDRMAFTSAGAPRLLNQEKIQNEPLLGQNAVRFIKAVSSNQTAQDCEPK